MVALFEGRQLVNLALWSTGQLFVNWSALLHPPNILSLVAFLLGILSTFHTIYPTGTLELGILETTQQQLFILSKCKGVKTSLSKRAKICKTTLKRAKCGFSFTSPFQKE